MPDISIDVEVEVFCASCGKGLCGQSKSGNSPQRGQPYIQVTPCKDCMGVEYDKGYTDALKKDD